MAATKKKTVRRFSKDKAGELFAILAHERPDPHTELNFVNPYTLVVAVALSAQATDVGVNKATEKLFEVADTPEKMLALGEAGVAELILLPGVGRKTANVVLNEAFGQPTIAVDTHIFRVSNRTGLSPGKTPDHVEEGLEKVTPTEFKLGAHHWLILHGRYVCLARKPKCWTCGIAHLCRFKDKTPDPDIEAGKPAKSSLGPRSAGQI